MPAVELSSLISETLASPRMDAQDLETDGEVCCLSLPMEVPDYDFYTEEINVDSLERWLGVQGVREVYSLNSIPCDNVSSECGRMEALLFQ